MSKSVSGKLDVTLVGGGMIVHDQILPSIYHLQRQGRVGSIKICATRSASLRKLAEEPVFDEAFPGQSFEAFPSLDADPDESNPDLFRKVIAAARPGQLVVVAVPDHLHADVIRTALNHDQHVLAVKPLVPTYAEALEIEHLAHPRGSLSRRLGLARKAAGIQQRLGGQNYLRSPAADAAGQVPGRSTANAATADQILAGHGGTSPGSVLPPNLSSRGVGGIRLYPHEFHRDHL